MHGILVMMMPLQMNRLDLSINPLEDQILFPSISHYKHMTHGIGVDTHTPLPQALQELIELESTLLMLEVMEQDSGGLSLKEVLLRLNIFTLTVQIILLFRELQIYQPIH